MAGRRTRAICGAVAPRDQAPATGRGLAPPLRLAAAGASALAADLAFDPTRRHVPLCPFHALTGLQCPLCGGLRGVQQLALGHPGTALHDNLLVVLALPFVLLGWLDWLRRDRAGLPRRRMPAAAVGALVVVALAFTVLRNRPG